MRRYWVLVEKEVRLLLRDGHGLLVLFAMPTLFILIMSLALPDSLNSGGTAALTFLIDNRNTDELGAQLASELNTLHGFAGITVQQDTDRASIQAQLADEAYEFAVIVPVDFAARLQAWNAPEDAAPVEVLLSPRVTPQTRLLLEMALNQSLHRLRLQTTLLPRLSALGISEQHLPKATPLLSGEYVFRSAGPQRGTPSAVQQSVPAWLVFGMFFVVIPLATAVLVERQQGSLVRLQVLRVSPWQLLAAKIGPYYLVNQVQMAAMLLIGMYMVPALGGDALNVPHSWLGLGLISSATSLAAIGFALMIATLVRSGMEATTLGGGSNIILAALGGIMVPKFVMPKFMQDVTVISPMSWGLEGFLDVFLRGGSWHEVLPEVTALLTFGALCLAVAAVTFKRQMRGMA